MLVCGVLKAVLREDLSPRVLSVMVVALCLAPLLLWRRTHPLAVVATVFGVITVVDLGLIASGTQALDVFTMLYVLLLPYALFRWGSTGFARAAVLPPAARDRGHRR